MSADELTLDSLGFDPEGFTPDEPEVQKMKAVESPEGNRTLGGFTLDYMLRNPTSVPRPTDAKELAGAINQYFGACMDADQRPTMTGLALSMGLTSVTSVERMGRRNEAYREIIGRALLAVANGYEAMLGSGSTSGAIFGLRNVPDGFDLDEPAGSPAPRFWQDVKQVELSGHISGVVSHEHKGLELSPEEAYAKIIEGIAIPEKLAPTDRIKYLPNEELDEYVPDDQNDD